MIDPVFREEETRLAVVLTFANHYRERRMSKLECVNGTCRVLGISGMVTLFDALVIFNAFVNKDDPLTELRRNYECSTAELYNSTCNSSK
jgi:hypothetical protein